MRSDESLEENRISSLKSYQVLDTLNEEEYDTITELASFICKTPISLISLIDENRQWFKSRVGLDIDETKRDIAFCDHAIRGSEILEIKDALEDKRFKENPLVVDEPNIRFYAGAPLITRDGYSLGTLCVIDRVPRELTLDQRNALERLAKQVMMFMELKKMGHRYETFFESTSDLIYELDRDGRYLHVNHTVERLLGYSADELKDRTCWEFVPDEYRDDTKKHYLEKIKLGEKSSYHEFPVMSKDGNLIWLGQSVDYFFDEDGMASRAYVIAKDMSEIKKAKDEKDQLVAMIAHDLKAPFNQIYSLSELLKINLEGDQITFNDMIGKISMDSREMIDDLIYLKSYESSGFTPELSEFDLKQFHDVKMTRFAKSARKKEINLEGRCVSQNPLVKGDEKSVGRIVDNLLSNAIKFSPSGSKVDFSIDVTNESILMEVRDEGPGFSKSDKSKAFGKFQKLSARPTGGESSTGLGLSIVRMLVEGLQGKIDLESEEGIGSKFTVTLPM